MTRTKSVSDFRDVFCYKKTFGPGFWETTRMGWMILVKC